MWTFQGPRIRDIRTYIRESFTDYAIRSFELMFWTFDEQEESLTVVIKGSYVRDTPVKKPPPHHRF